MFTEPRIILNKDLKKRAYVSFYFNGVNQKIYTGNKIGLEIYPNNAKVYKDRKRLLVQLQSEISIRLKDGTFDPDGKVIDLSVNTIVNEALNRKLNDNLSRYYKNDLKYVTKAFLKSLPNQLLKGSILELKTKDKAFRSGITVMNIRQTS